MNVMLISLGRAIKKHRLAVIFISLISSSAVLGILVALQFQPIETVIEQTQPTVAKEVSQSKGQYTISYTTTGPSILSFGKDCDDGKGSLMYYCGIDLQFDGKGGIIDLKIPAALMNEIDPIREVFTSYLLYPTQLPFQRISNDDNYSVFRIEVPANFDEIKMRIFAVWVYPKERRTIISRAQASSSSWSSRMDESVTFLQPPPAR